MWMRCNIPMARGLGFSGAVRVGAAALAVVQRGDAIDTAAGEILDVATELEGHGDNVAASLHGGVVAFVGGRAIPFALGPVLVLGGVRRLGARRDHLHQRVTTHVAHQRRREPTPSTTSPERRSSPWRSPTTTPPCCSVRPTIGCIKRSACRPWQEHRTRSAPALRRVRGARG